MYASYASEIKLRRTDWFAWNYEHRLCLALISKMGYEEATFAMYPRPSQRWRIDFEHWVQ